MQSNCKFNSICLQMCPSGKFVPVRGLCQRSKHESIVIIWLHVQFSLVESSRRVAANNIRAGTTTTGSFHKLRQQFPSPTVLFITTLRQRTFLLRSSCSGSYTLTLRKISRLSLLCPAGLFDWVWGAFVCMGKFHHESPDCLQRLKASNHREPLWRTLCFKASWSRRAVPVGRWYLHWPK